MKKIDNFFVFLVKCVLKALCVPKKVRTLAVVYCICLHKYLKTQVFQFKSNEILFILFLIYIIRVN